MNSNLWKSVGKHALVYGVFILTSFLLYLPYVTQNKVLHQSDNVQAFGMQQEIQNYHKETGYWPLWTNGPFSGMPVYQILNNSSSNQTGHVFNAMMWTKSITLPHFVTLVAMLCTYLFLLTLGIPWWMALIGGVCFGWGNHMVNLAEAGHSNKMIAIAFLPGVWAGIALLTRHKFLLGTGVLALFTSMQILANHFQITYYTFLIAGIWLLFWSVRMIMDKAWLSVGKVLLCMLLAVGLGILSNTSQLWTTQEYAQETIRGGSELQAQQKRGKGLDKEYAFGWSLGIGESATLLAQNAKGGGASQAMTGTSIHDQYYNNVYSRLTEQGYAPDEARRNAEQQIASLFYWGDQAFVSMGIYFGIILIFLGILGIILARGVTRWCLLTMLLFSLSIAWGKNFFFNDFLFDYFPLFNKFRAVSMILSVTHLVLLMCAMYGLYAILYGRFPLDLNREISQDQKKKALWMAGGITAGLCIIAWISGMSGGYTGIHDDQLEPALKSALFEDRASLLKKDILRSLLFLILAMGVLWAWLSSKLRWPMAVGAIALLCLVDLFQVDKRVLFPEKFQDIKENEAAVAEREADKIIKADPDPYYRVMDLSAGNPFSSALASYHHKSVGGYHAAKLQRYQEVIEKYLTNPSANMHILGMLNTKYLIQSTEGGKTIPIPNVQALGNAWFVQNVEQVKDADAELNALATLKPAQTAIVRADMYGLQKNWPAASTDTTATIKLTKYSPDTLIYKYSSSSDRVCVFSEIYYPPSKGWSLYVNGKEAGPLMRMNYILRGAVLPAGTDVPVMMVFHPKSYYQGESISTASSITVLVLALGAIGWSLFQWVQKGGGTPEPVPVDPERPVRNTPQRETARPNQKEKRKR